MGALAKQSEVAERADFMATCKHFNGIQNECCKARVRFSALRLGDKVLPCAPVFTRHAGSKPIATCADFREQSEQDYLDDRAETQAVIDRFTKVMPAVRAWRTHPKPAVDRSGVIECPVCKGELSLRQSHYNGHVHGHCATPGCVSWVE